MNKMYKALWPKILNANVFLCVLYVWERTRWDLCASSACRVENVYLFMSNTEALYVCEWVHKSVRLSLCLSCCSSEWRGNSCASGGKHIGQLRLRLCTALLCVSLIESERQPLTALRLRTLQVITHKSPFPCIGSSAQLRPHKQSASVSFITSGCLLTFSDTQSDRQFRYITLSIGCYCLSLQDNFTGFELYVDVIMC